MVPEASMEVFKGKRQPKCLSSCGAYDEPQLRTAWQDKIKVSIVAHTLLGSNPITSLIGLKILLKRGKSCLVLKI